MAEAPRAYPSIPELLRRARPQGVLPLPGPDGEAPASFPQDNEAAEQLLRAALWGLRDETPARAEIEALEASHGRRRHDVWATLGQAPLAVALVPLAALARATKRPLGGTTVATIAAAYVDWG